MNQINSMDHNDFLWKKQIRNRSDIVQYNNRIRDLWTLFADILLEYKKNPEPSRLEELKQILDIIDDISVRALLGETVVKASIDAYLKFKNANIKRVEDYKQIWFEIAKNTQLTQTYKVVLGIAVLELIFETATTIADNEFILSFETIAERVLELYWKPIIILKLNQGNMHENKSVIMDLLTHYNNRLNPSSYRIPLTYYEAKTDLLDKGLFNELLNKLVIELKTYPIKLLPKIKKGLNYEDTLYTVNNKKGTLIFECWQVNALLEIHDELKASFYERWQDKMNAVNKHKVCIESKKDRYDFIMIKEGELCA